MSAELKPCPICGGPASAFRVVGPTALVSCDIDCVMTETHPTLKAAVKVWNTRASVQSSEEQAA